MKSKPDNTHDSEARGSSKAIADRARWIRGCSLVRRSYRSRPGWNRDHCIGCWTTFSEESDASSVAEGFTTYTRWDWLCGNCFGELREPLNLRLMPSRVADQLANGLLDIQHAHQEEWVPHVRQLLFEYGASLGMKICQDAYAKEMASLPGEYDRNIGKGCLLIAIFNDRHAGCVALRNWRDEIAEMKRLYVRPDFRGHGLGETLTRAILDEARRLGYSAIRLDTLPDMDRAHRLYESLGFRKIPPYLPKPLPGALHMELNLT